MPKYLVEAIRTRPELNGLADFGEMTRYASTSNIYILNTNSKVTAEFNNALMLSMFDDPNIKRMKKLG